MAKRAVRLVLFLIGFAVFISLAGTALLYFAVSRGPSVPATATLVLKPGGELPEAAREDVVGQLFGSDTRTLRGFVNSLRYAKRDPRIKSVLLMPGALESPYWAKVQELRDAVIDFRRSGKRVTAYLEYG